MEDFRRKIILVILVAAVIVFLSQTLPPLLKGSGPTFKGLFNLPFGSPAQPAGQEAAVKKEAVSRRFDPGEISPFFGEVRISAMNFSALPPSLKVTFSGGQKAANITGWRIKTNSRDVSIPQAFEVYTSSGGANRDIVLLSGQSAVFYGAGNRFGNFKVNKCTGFLQDAFNFNPALGLVCPAAGKSEIINLSGKCQNYISSLPSCSLPGQDFISTLSSDYADSNCRDFLERINYDACAKKHARDKDFVSGEWRIWLGQNIFDSQHDWVRLFDEKGLLVDEFIY